MLPRENRLTSAQFERAFSKSQTLRHPLLTLRVHRRDDAGESVRAAFVVPKKIAKKATARNAIRRQMREAYRLHPLRDLPRGSDLIFLATDKTGAASREELNAALGELLGRAKGKTRGPKLSVKSEKPPSQQPRLEEGVSPAISETPRNSGADALFQSGESEARSEALNLQKHPPLTAFALALIRFYQRFISPSLPPSCRFTPSCSHYTLAAIERFGLCRGAFLGARRICCCQPLCEGGYDPVPERFPTLFPFSKTREHHSKSS